MVHILTSYSYPWRSLEDNSVFCYFQASFLKRPAFEHFFPTEPFHDNFWLDFIFDPRISRSGAADYFRISRSVVK
jgi:hypothetical protein